MCLMVDFQPTTVDGDSMCLMVDFQPTTVDGDSMCLMVDFQPTTVDGGRYVSDGRLPTNYCRW